MWDIYWKSVYDELVKNSDLYKELLEENKKLKERVEELEQCNLNLQTWLDNKEKVNKSLREENKRLSDYES